MLTDPGHCIANMKYSNSLYPSPPQSSNLKPLRRIVETERGSFGQRERRHYMIVIR